MTYLGNGHDGIWTLFATIGTAPKRRKIPAWFHHYGEPQSTGSQQRLAQVEADLWQGDVDAAIERFRDWPHEQPANFIVNSGRTPIFSKPPNKAVLTSMVSSHPESYKTEMHPST